MEIKERIEKFKREVIFNTGNNWIEFKRSVNSILSYILWLILLPYYTIKFIVITLWSWIVNTFKFIINLPWLIISLPGKLWRVLTEVIWFQSYMRGILFWRWVRLYLFVYFPLLWIMISATYDIRTRRLEFEADNPWFFWIFNTQIPANWSLFIVVTTIWILSLFFINMQYIFKNYGILWIVTFWIFIDMNDTWFWHQSCHLLMWRFETTFYIAQIWWNFVADDCAETEEFEYWIAQPCRFYRTDHYKNKMNEERYVHKKIRYRIMYVNWKARERYNWVVLSMLGKI